MNNFEMTGLLPEIVKAVQDLGFVSPTPIQQECIPYLLNSHDDLIANAQTGTGKTAAFGLPVLSKIDSGINHEQCLILSPTRELAIQIKNDLENYSKYMNNLKIACIYGGASVEPQIRELKMGPQIVVGTPGRVLDMVKRKKLNLSQINYLVLDEADEMLNMGFKDDLDAILEQANSERQTLLFSATMPSEILRIAKNYMRNANEISVGRVNSGAEMVEHFYHMVSARDKYLALKRVADMNPNIYGLVFCRTRTETKEVAEKLIRDGYNADALHGDLSQAQREHVMTRFRIKNLQILVATDVAARGLDVNDLTHVVNYNLPDDPEVYVHRSGRTGRAGKNGISISIIHSHEKGKMRMIEKMIGKPITYLEVANGRQICEKQLFNMISKMENVEVDETQIEGFMDVIYKKLEWLSKEDIIKKFVSLEFNRFLDYYKDSRDLNIKNDSRGGREYDRDGDRDRGRRDRDRGRERDRDRDRDRGSSFGDRSEKREKRSSRNDERPVSRDRDRKERGTEAGFERLFINLGSKDGVGPKNIIGLINDSDPKLNAEIGRIEILRNFSFVEVESKHAQKLVSVVSGAQYNDRTVSLELAGPKPDFAKQDKPRGEATEKKERRSDKSKKAGFWDNIPSFDDRPSKPRSSKDGDRPKKRRDDRESDSRGSRRRDR